MAQVRRSFPVTLCAAVVAVAGACAALPDVAGARESAPPGVQSGRTQGLDGSRMDDRTLQAALVVAGRGIAKLPIVLVSVKPDIASPGVQAWTAVDAGGKSTEIFVYTESRIFRCARVSTWDSQCVLKLASVLVHEAWHFEHGGNEADAYATQIVFLMGNGGTRDQIADVRRSRDRVLAAGKEAGEAARRRYRNLPRS
jgi:hypothetical protein